MIFRQVYCTATILVMTMCVSTIALAANTEIPTAAYMKYIDVKAPNVLCNMQEFDGGLVNRGNRSCLEIMGPISKRCSKSLKSNGPMINRKELGNISRFIFFCHLESLMSAESEGKPALSTAAMKVLEPKFGWFMFSFLGLKENSWREFEANL